MSALKKLELLPGEEKVDTWSVNYLPPGGGRVLGKLLVTNRRLDFDAGFDASAKDLVEADLFHTSGKLAWIAIPRERFADVDARTSFFKKQVMVTLDDGQVHIFDYGMLSIKKLLAAIQGT